MQKIANYLLVGIGFSLVMSGIDLNAATLTKKRNPWYFSTGYSLNFLFDTHNVAGDLESPDIPNTHFILNSTALGYTTQATPQIVFGYGFTDFFDLGLLFAKVSSTINTTQAAISSGSGASPGEIGMYAARLTMSNFILQPRFVWRNMAHLGCTAISPYLSIEFGASFGQLSNQTVLLNNGAISAEGPLQAHSNWNFSWGGELGVINSVSDHVDISYGVRYLNYGKFNSGTTFVDYPFPMIQAVSATLYSVSPFLTFAYNFQI